MKKTLHVFAIACISLLALPAAAQIPAYVPTDGLVGWWPFNGNANDESGNGNDGVVNGAILTDDRNGLENTAYNFDGVDDYINVPFNEILHGTVGTVNAWIKTTAQFTAQKNIFSQSSGRPQLLAASENASGNEYTHFAAIQWKASNGEFPNSQSISEVDNSEWQMITGYYSQDTFKIYINGVLENLNITSLSQDNCSQSDFQIGGFNTSGNCQSFVGLSQMFDGIIDDIAIYNRALTEQEIQNLYTGTTPPPCVSLPSNLQQGLVGYWPFCGNANDESGNGNDGTVNGATLTEDRFGNSDAAYDFDGVDDFIKIDSTVLSGEFQSFTIAYWFKKSTNTQIAQAVINDRTTNGYKYYSNFASNNEFNGAQAGLENYSNSSSSYVLTTSGASQHDGTWNNIIWILDSQSLSMSIYRNGLMESETIINPLSWVTQDAPTIIGASENFPGDEQFFNGSLDDIGIWNRALTPEEVQELYTLDACTFTVYDTTHVTVYDTLTTYETVYDTLYTYETIYDTVTTYVTVTDTLLIDITFTGFEGQPSWLNTVTVFPNPASDHITIDYGNFALMAGYNTVITDAAGATVYSSAVNSQQAYIDINAWGAAGVYYMTIYDAIGTAVAVRHIVLE